MRTWRLLKHALQMKGKWFQALFHIKSWTLQDTLLLSAQHPENAGTGLVSINSHLNHQGRHVGSLDECSRGHLLDEELDEELCNTATAHVDEGINQQQIPEHA